MADKDRVRATFQGATHRCYPTAIPFGPGAFSPRIFVFDVEEYRQPMFPAKPVEPECIGIITGHTELEFAAHPEGIVFQNGFQAVYRVVPPGIGAEAQQEAVRHRLVILQATVKGNNGSAAVYGGFFTSEEDALINTIVVHIFDKPLDGIFGEKRMIVNIDDHVFLRFPHPLAVVGNQIPLGIRGDPMIRAGDEAAEVNKPLHAIHFAVNGFFVHRKNLLVDVSDAP